MCNIKQCLHLVIGCPPSLLPNIQQILSASRNPERERPLLYSSGSQQTDLQQTQSKCISDHTSWNEFSNPLSIFRCVRLIASDHDTLRYPTVIAECQIFAPSQCLEVFKVNSIQTQHFNGNIDSHTSIFCDCVDVVGDRYSICDQIDTTLLNICFSSMSFGTTSRCT